MRGTALSSGISNKTSKLGRRVYSFSLPRVTTCPGMSKWCEKNCYMAKLERLYKTMLASYQANLENATVHAEALGDEIVADLAKKKNVKAVRIHVDGDFFSAPYIRMWISIAERSPDTRFYAYTRAWTVKRLRKALDDLSALPNFTLWASVDDTMPSPPEAWRAAWIEGDDRARGPVCPEQVGKVDSCTNCGLCFKTKLANITFRVH